MIAFDDICAARDRIADRVQATPLIRAREIEDDAGVPVYLKCELFQLTGSFKPRGALNWVRTANSDEVQRGLITISAGNHALALAWAAREAGARLKVVMPEGSSPRKVDATRAFGAEVILHGDINAATAKLHGLIEAEGLTLVHPFDDPRVMAGQGTVGLEITEQMPDVAEVLCPVGGGGLVSGIAVAMKAQSPDVRITGLEPERAATLRRAWDHGGPVRLDRADSVAASLGASLAGRHTYEASRAWVDDVLTLSEDDIVSGVRETFARCKLFAEPGATLGVAALLRKRIPPPKGPVVVVITGGNLDFSLARALLSTDT